MKSFLCLFLTSGLLFALVHAQSAELKTEFFRLPAMIWAGEPEDENLFPRIVNGFEREPRTRSRDAQPYFAKRKIAFPPGASATYYEGASILGMTNTAENLTQLGKLLGPEKLTKISAIQHELRIVEYAPEIEEQLEVRATFPALLAKLGDKAKWIYEGTISSKPSWVAAALIGGKVQPLVDPKGNVQTVVKDTSGWPPPAEAEVARFEVATNAYFSNDVFEVVCQFHYATAARKDRPPVLTSLFTNVTVRQGIIYKLQTFTAADRIDGPLRHYAVLLRCEWMDGAGRPVVQLREMLRKTPEKLLEPVPEVDFPR